MTAEPDARRLLGLAADADADAVRAARRRLAKAIHPDVEGGSGDAMRQLNEATDTVLAQLAGNSTGNGSGPAPDSQPSSSSRPSSWSPPSSSPPSSPPPSGGTGRVAHDVASFVIEALPAEAFEALLVVTSWLGEVADDDPPYQLDVLLLDPLRCWCRLDLVPDAGASTVSVTIGALPDEPLPAIDDVRDLWVSSLNHLGSAPV